MLEFKNKVALVSGAASGIGLETANALKELGAFVIGLDVKFGDQWIEKEGILQIGLDVSDTEAVNEIIDWIEEEYGSIEYLANIAGILKMGSLLSISQKDWESTLSVNFTGTFNLCRAVARKMLERKRGSIVAIGSNASHTPRLGLGSYAASKAGLTQFIKCLGLELAPHNIRCNVVSPGSTYTNMQKVLWEDHAGEQKVIKGDLDQYRLGIPLGRMANPSQISDLILFMLSNKSSHITMENITIDGGATLGV